MNKSAPRKRLPVHPSIEHLQKQAKRLAKQDPVLKLAEAQQRLARDYGCKNWAELSRVVEAMRQGGDQLANVKREIGPLPKAARDVNMPEVRRLLEEGNYLPLDLDRALAHALWYGPPSTWPERKEIADLAMEYGADPDAQYGSNYGPTVFGTGECIQPEGLQYLIDAGADVTFAPIETKYGKLCPLDHILGTYGRGENERKHRYIDILLKHGGFVPEAVTPPILAIHRGDAEKLDALLKDEPDLVAKRFPDMPYGNIGLRGGTLLHCAIEFGEMDCVKLLLDRHADINGRATVIDGVGGQTPVFHAIASMGDHHVPLLEYLIGRVGQWIDWSVKAAFLLHGKAVEPVTPIEYALRGVKEAEASAGKKRELELLRRAAQKEQVKAAIRSGELESIVRLLHAHPEFLDGELWPVAVYEAKSLPVTKLLLERGLDPNQCSAPRLPLHLAVYQVLPDVVEALVRGGADADRVNKLGERPLELLDAYEPRPVGDPEVGRIKEILVQAGARVDFLSAVRMGDVPLLEKLHAAGEAIPPNALHAAARSGRVEVARLLLERGANADEINGKKNTPLWFAAQSPAKPASDRIAVMKLLLDAGADIHRRCEDGTTALHFAAWRGPMEVVEFLLSRGARNWNTDDHGKTPGDYARDKSVAVDKEAIAALLSMRQMKDPDINAAMEVAKEDELELLRNGGEKERVSEAIRSRNLDEVARLLDAHPEFLDEDLWPAAIWEPGGVPMTKFLLERGLDPNQGSKLYEPPLHRAVLHVLPDIVEALLRAGADASLEDKQGTRPIELLNLFDKRPMGDPDVRRITDLLMRAGASLDMVSAVRIRDESLLEQRLGQGDAVPPSALNAAARIGCPEVVQLLLSHGADPNGIDEKKNTALWSVAQSAVKPAADRIAVMRLLLDAGADIHQRCSYGTTSLHFAAWRGPVEVVEFLLSRGARNWITDDHGKKSLDYARERSVAADKEEIVALFSSPRVKDANFKEAIRAMEAGDLEGMKRVLAEHPYLVTARAEEEGWFAGPYFKHPYLLEFVAENPIRTGKLPGNICGIAQVIIDAFNHKGHKEHKGEAITRTLGLVASGSVARECGVQVPLLELLVKNGADATEGLNAAVMHGEMQAAEALLRLGAKADMVAAAGLGLRERLVELLDAEGDVPGKKLGDVLAAAIRHGHWNTAEVILDRGFPLDEEMQQSGTALHHAAWAGHRDICERLIARGADVKRKDRQWQGTAGDWARHGGHAELGEWLG